jgi:ketosteroid isomerase-like protein
VSRLRTVLVGIGLTLLPTAGPAQSASSADSSFRAFLPTFEGAINSMVNGDGALWGALLSTKPGTTLFSPFGAVYREPPTIGRRYQWVAKQFVPGHHRVQVEYLNVAVSGDLAAVVALERGTFRLAGSDSTGNSITRATMIFRREDGSWKLRHRHMDHLTEESPKK